MSTVITAAFPKCPVGEVPRILLGYCEMLMDLPTTANEERLAQLLQWDTDEAPAHAARRLEVFVKEDLDEAVQQCSEEEDERKRIDEMTKYCEQSVLVLTR